MESNDEIRFSLSDLLSPEESEEIENGEVTEDTAVLLAKKILARKIRLHPVLGRSYPSSSSSSRQLHETPSSRAKSTPSKKSTPKSTPTAPKKTKKTVTAREAGKKMTTADEIGEASTAGTANVDATAAKANMAAKRKRESVIDITSESEYAPPAKKSKTKTPKTLKTPNRKRAAAPADSDTSSDDEFQATPPRVTRRTAGRAAGSKSSPLTPTPAPKGKKTAITPVKKASAKKTPAKKTSAPNPKSKTVATTPAKSSLKAGSDVTKSSGSQAKKTWKSITVAPRAKGPGASKTALERHVHFDIDILDDEEPTTTLPKSPFPFPRTQQKATGRKAIAKAVSVKSTAKSAKTNPKIPSPVEGMVYAHGLLFPAPDSPLPPISTRTRSHSPTNKPPSAFLSRRKSKAPPPKRQSKRQKARNRKRSVSATSPLSDLEVWDETTSLVTDFTLLVHPLASALWDPVVHSLLPRGFVTVASYPEGFNPHPSSPRRGYGVACAEGPGGGVGGCLGAVYLFFIIIIIFFFFFFFFFFFTFESMRKRMEGDVSLEVLGIAEAMESLTSEVGLGMGRAEELEGRYEAVFDTLGEYLQDRGQVEVPSAMLKRRRLSWWSFDEALLDASQRLSDLQDGEEEYEFDMLLAENGKGAALAGITAAESAESVVEISWSGNGGAELDRLVADMGWNFSVRDVLRVLQGEIETVLEDQEGDGDVEDVLPCGGCSGGARGEKPWVRPLVKCFGFTEEEAQWSTEWEFIQAVENQGGVLVDRVPGLEIMVDGTAGETRTVLVEIGSALDDIMMELEGIEPGTPHRQPVGVREDWDSGVLAGERTI
ncbi:hypothetical protein B0T14DRAFT_571900 [Immersiella caudata]|uniref:Uncharacterized protein n=1 Tax=Immersiella caudata TaxID=314043 RepID=A0AA39U456_9PEZI|nr:hypothetical protein B0T14DRAFT_571900 [Immersiella caudata]